MATTMTTPEKNSKKSDLCDSPASPVRGSVLLAQ